MQLPIKEVDPGLMQESGNVDAVGHEPDRIVFGPNLWPLVGSQAGRDGAVDPAHAIDPSGSVQGEACHVEQARRGRRARQVQNPVQGNAELTNEVAEVRNDQIMAERVVPGGYRCMRCENTAGRNGFQRYVERQALSEMLAQQLENQKRRMAFVQMPYGWLDSERPQRADTADTQDHLLPDARGLVTPVETVCDVSVRWRVLRTVRI